MYCRCVQHKRANGNQKALPCQNSANISTYSVGWVQQLWHSWLSFDKATYLGQSSVQTTNTEHDVLEKARKLCCPTPALIAIASESLITDAAEAAGKVDAPSISCATPVVPHTLVDV